MRIPKCMSTQHPDNVNSPFFAEHQELAGEDEIKEAFYAFSHLNCDEQMWDCEGKETDSYVVKKLLTQYSQFFKEHELGKDFNLTLRVPNPTVEKAEAKVLLETLESIPRSHDAAKLFYQNGTSPIFEVILPMTSSAKEINRIYHYYQDFVAGKEEAKLGDTTIGKWIGEFHPKTVNVIPLFESYEHMLGAADITKEYLKDKNPEYQRTFLARSDPSMNYGNITAVILNKIALQKFDELSKDLNIPIYPILGAGSAPFRGNLRPENHKSVSEEYPSVQTFTLQSSFKYDNSPLEVRKAIRELQDRSRQAPHQIEQAETLKILEPYSQCFRKQVIILAPHINKVAQFIPARRKRKLHIGLFGYSRDVDGVQLPRAIKFTAALYSLGIPPELLGFDALDTSNVDFLKKSHIHLETDMKQSMRFLNPDSPFVPENLSKQLHDVFGEVEVDKEHQKFSNEIIKALQENKAQDSVEPILHAANLRGFLG